MGKMPSSPDPTQVANAQGNANYTNAQQNVAFGNANVNSPYGTSTWDQTGWQAIYDNKGNVSGYSPRYTQNISLSPAQQKLLDLQQKTQTAMGQTALQQVGRLAKTYSKDMNVSGLSPWQAAERPDAVRRDEAPTDRAAIEAAMMQRYDEDAMRQNAAEQNQAISRGMMPGGQGYGTMIKGEQDARARANREAFLTSGDESRRAQAAYNQAVGQEYQMGADWSAQLNNLHQAQLTERQILREQPLKEAMTMAGFSGPSTPTFQSFQGTQMNAVPIGDYIYQKSNADRQDAANRMSGIFNTVGQVAGMMPWSSWLGSDRRLKQDINRLPGRELAGCPLYAFTYRRHVVVPKKLWGTRHVGVMADEVIALHPDAVRRLEDGFDRVNYELLYERDSTWPKAAVARKAAA